MITRELAPLHPGLHVKEELDYLNLSINAYAKLIDVNPSTVSRLVSGNAGISAEMALRLAATIGSTAEHWIRLQNSFDLWHAKHSIDVSQMHRIADPHPAEHRI